jgi:hypothetical protein
MVSSAAVAIVKRVLLFLGVLILLGAAFAGGYVYARLAPEGSEESRGVDCGGPDLEAKSLDSAQAAIPKLYAPVVFLHPDEKFLPMSADCYLRSTGLLWAHERRSADSIVDEGKVVFGNLGKGFYRFRAAPEDCTASGPCAFRTNAFTRPYEQGRKGLAEHAGFFLDVEDDYRFGARNTATPPLYAGAPVYYDFEPGRFVTYWFFYGFSAPFAQLVDRGIERIGHEADWERISVRLNARNQPLEVRYQEHRRGNYMPWVDVPRIGTHPIVFSAEGSHGSYSRPGRFREALDVAKAGLIWPTWNELLDVRKQPWYGYGGAWGVARKISKSTLKKVGRQLEPYGITVAEGDFTGPIGPSAYKAPVPEGWLGR